MAILFSQDGIKNKRRWKGYFSLGLRGEFGKKEGLKMEGKASYSECELRYIDQGYDPTRAAETCAADEGRSSDEQSGKSGQDESREDYWGDF